MTGAALGAICSVALVGCGAGGSSTAPRTPEFGFSDNAVTQGLVSPSVDAKLLAAAGARVSRVQFDWRFAEPRRGAYRLAGYDAIYRAYARQHIRMLLILAYAPGWAGTRRCRTPCLQAPARAHYADAADTAAFLARRYPKLAGIEIWNEPNTQYFWGGPPDPTAYATLLRLCYRAVKRARPRMAVVGGSLVDAVAAGSISVKDFLTAMLRAGAGADMDALSVHPYAPPGDLRGDTTLAVLRDAREALRAGGADRLPIWVTELGVSTTGQYAATNDQQAAALTTAIRRIRRINGVRMILVHTLIEPNSGLLDVETGFGVLSRGLQPKPAYCALAVAAGKRVACPAR